MNFSELLNVAYDKRCDVIDIHAIARLFPTAPDPVQEMYSHHGRKDAFQAQYGHINIALLHWEKVCLPASKVVSCSIYPGFTDWVGNVAHRIDTFHSESWSCIDRRPAVVEHWCLNETWVVPPILLANTVLRMSSELHLMEGHTRIGILQGLLSHGIVKPNSEHYIWQGTF